MGAEAGLQVIHPIAGVFLVAGDPVHGAVAVTFIVFPVAFVEIARRVGHLSLAPLHAFLPVTLVDGAILVAQFTVTVAHTVDPLALVLDTFFSVDVGALTVAQTIHNLALVGAAVTPVVGTLASDLVLTELSLVERTICPLKGTLTVEQTKTELSLVLMAVFKDTGALSMEHFANLSILLVIDDIASPVLDDELCKLRRQECNAR